jgi:hypothetical protein
MAIMALTGALAFTPVLTQAETVISKDVFSTGGYCHTKFESIREDTLASSEPVLKDVDDLVDFYGPCNHDPLGKEEIQAQKIEVQHRFATEYEDWKGFRNGGTAMIVPPLRQPNQPPMRIHWSRKEPLLCCSSARRGFFLRGFSGDARRIENVLRPGDLCDVPEQ